MKKIIMTMFAIFSVLTLSINLAEARNVKFAQVTDVHFKNNSYALNKIVRDINKNKDIDFVVFTGDNIGSAKPVNLKKFIKDASELEKPFYVVLGAKDVSKHRGLSKEQYMKIVRSENKFHPSETNYVFKKKGVIFIAVDGSKEYVPSDNGFYNKETLDWLDAQLTKYRKGKVVIFQHYPLANRVGDEFNYTYNAIEYLQMLSKHNNVIAVITGHYHKNDEIIYNGVKHITTPAASNGFYKIIDIDCDNDYEVYTIIKEVQ